MDGISRQLKKGVIDILLLQLLSKDTMYGYELMEKLQLKSDGVFATKEGTLYPILYRLEDAGYILSEWDKERERRGVPRKYYSITQEGRCHLAEARKELQLLTRGIRMIMGEN